MNNIAANRESLSSQGFETIQLSTDETSSGEPKIDAEKPGSFYSSISGMLLSFTALFIKPANAQERNIGNQEKKQRINDSLKTASSTTGGSTKSSLLNSVMKFGKSLFGYSSVSTRDPDEASAIPTHSTGSSVIQNKKQTSTQAASDSAVTRAADNARFKELQGKLQAANEAERRSPNSGEYEKIFSHEEQMEHAGLRAKISNPPI